ncbi:MAG: DNA gyrase/topoisomerase IV subunit A, partial [Bacteroidales bacterium]|nr:DNA gyrase/topoisomerase IV subunit A [Bacteroidales bacterium]
SLENIFFEQRIYRELERDVDTWEITLSNIEKQLEPYAHLLRQPITRDDVVKLTEKPVRKISKFDIKKADEYIKGLEVEIDEVQNHLAHIVDYVIAYYQQVKKKHGKGRERRTELLRFDNIEAAKVVVANEKLYIDRAEGFVGTALKGDGVELVSPCSNIDDVIVFLKDGRFFVKKVQEKDFVGKDIIHAAVYTKNDTNTVYNVLYRDGLNGCIMMKRCNITGTTRDREYNITKGTPRSEILFFSANPNGETDILKVFLKPRPRLRNLILELNFADIAIKGRGAAGNIFTRFAIHKLQAKEKVAQTAGQKVWFDADVLRLNTEGVGTLVGEFALNAMVLTIMRNGSYHLTGQPFSARFDELPMRIEPFDPDRIFTAIYRDEAQKLYYLKRFRFEPSNRDQTILPEGERLTLVGLSPELYPSVLLGTVDRLGKKQTQTIDADAFIAVKGVRAKGKRLANYELRSAVFGQPLQKERSAFADEATATAQPEAEVQPANEPDAPQGLNLKFDS